MREETANRVLHDRIYQLAQCVRERYVFPTQGSALVNLKPGLRNADGTGVLIGLTGLGSVQGYMILDGESIPMPGRLYYRGIDIRQIVDAHIADNVFGFEEVAYLLLFGKLPAAHDLEQYRETIASLYPLPEGAHELVLHAPKDCMMSRLAWMVQSLFSFDKNSEDDSPENLLAQSLRLIAWMPLLVVHGYLAQRTGHVSLADLPTPDEHLSLAENILRMFREDQAYRPEEAHLLDLMMSIHAEHGGGTPSTFVCRMLTSIGTDTYGTIAATINAFKGPRDSGVSIKVLEMYADVCRNVPNLTDEELLADYLRRIRDGEANDGSGKIYGLGHTVYTQSDPRALLVKHAAREMAEKTGYSKDFENIERIERLGLKVLQENQRTPKVMCANVDMYSGLVFRMLKIPDDFFAPLLTIAHMPSWCAHRLEEALSSDIMMRPAYRAIAKRMDYVPIDQRG